MSNIPEPPKTLEQILDAHAEYYIRQTMKFFQNEGESPALSKNNEGDLMAFAALKALALREALEIVDKMGKDPMPRIGRSGKYIKSLQSFQDGFEEARVEFWQVINDHYGGGDK